MNVRMTRLRVGSSLIALAGTALLSAAPAMAQDQAQAAAAPAADAAQPAMEEIVVTGSHIKQNALQQQVPIVALSASQLQATGITNLADNLNKLPQFGIPGVSNVSSNFSDDNAGVSTINLRNLGEERTLVLIDGRRTVSGNAVGQGPAAVDINTIPTFLIDGIDIVTNAGAQYGSEAVAGVVNIRLKDHYEGLMVNEQYGLTTDYADGNTETFDLLTGTSFADGNGHITFGLEYNDEGSVLSKDREYANRDYNTGANGQPVYTPSSYTLGGNFLAYKGNPNRSGLYAVDPAGAPVLYGPSQGFDRNPVRTIQIPTDAIKLYEKAEYDITPDIEFHIDGRYSRSTATTQLEPIAIDGEGTTTIGFAGNYLRMPLDNYYATQFLNAHGLTAVPAGATSQYFGDWRRRFLELGDRSSDSTRTNFAYNVGFKGDLMDNRFTWHADYTFSEMDNEQVGASGNVLKLQQALRTSPTLVNGQVVCASAAARAHGCVPINFFGYGTASAAAVNYIKDIRTYTDQNQENDLNLDISGPIYTLPWANAGDVSLAAGFEYRTESGYNRGDKLSSSGFDLDTSQPASGGSYSVEDYWLESKVEVLKDLDFAKSLTLNGSWRYSDYSNTNVGGKQSYSYGLTYAPVEDIQFRVTNGVAIRAPDLSDLYQGRGNSAVSVNDPCAAAQLAGALNKANRIANCLKIPGMAARLGPNPGSPTNPNGQFVENIAQQQSELGYIQGNPALTNERAQVFTYGVTFNPRWVSGLSAKVDAFKYKIANAVQSIDIQTEANQCADTQEANFCDTVRRYGAGSLNAGLIQGVDQEPINVGSLDERGVDVEVTYGFALNDVWGGADGRLDVDWFYTFVQQFEYTSINGTTTNLRGLFGAPKNRWNLNTTYSNDNLEFNWQLRYQGSQSYDGGLGGPTFQPFVYNDISLHYHITDQITPYVGVNNLLNVKPPLVTQEYQQTGAGNASGVTGTNTVPDVYDAIGRYIYFGVKYTMNWEEAPAEAAAYVPPPVVAPAPSVPRSYLVFFDFNKSDLTSQAVTIVDTAARNATNGKVTQLTVTGHTDTVGSDAYNMRLSRRRAESVAAQLEKDGIASSEIEIVAKGKRDLLVPTGDGVREPQNRRVQIVFDGGPTS